MKKTTEFTVTFRVYTSERKRLEVCIIKDVSV